MQINQTVLKICYVRLFNKDIYYIIVVDSKWIVNTNEFQFFIIGNVIS